MGKELGQGRGFCLSRLNASDKHGGGSNVPHSYWPWRIKHDKECHPALIVSLFKAVCRKASTFERDNKIPAFLGMKISTGTCGWNKKHLLFYKREARVTL